MSDNLLIALVSGCTASGITATITYPLDFLKTQQQLNNNNYMNKWKVPANYPLTIAQLYKGGSALVLGSVIKNSTRLISYNWLTKFMSTDTPKQSAPRIVIAGAISGFFETMCLIPFENVKITMIQNQTLSNELNRTRDFKYDITGHLVPQSLSHTNIFKKQYVSPLAYFTSDVIAQFKGHKPSRFTHQHTHHPKDIDSRKIRSNRAPALTFFGTVKEMYELKGISAFTAGTCITYVRQIAVLTAWIWTYNATRQLVNPNSGGEQRWFGHQHTMLQLVGLHFLSLLAVVTLTQPLDVIKTHLQLKNGKAIYRDSLTTAYKLFILQGPRALFKGSLPRGIKVLVNGGLTASLYAYIEQFVVVAGGQTVFTNE